MFSKVLSAPLAPIFFTIPMLSIMHLCNKGLVPRPCLAQHRRTCGQELFLQQSLGSGGKPLFFDQEQKVFDWILGKRQAGLQVTTWAVRRRMEFELQESKVPEKDWVDVWKENWWHRFSHRWHLSLRNPTHLAQRLPQELEEKVIRFHRFFIKLQ